MFVLHTWKYFSHTIRYVSPTHWGYLCPAHLGNICPIHRHWEMFVLHSVRQQLGIFRNFCVSNVIREESQNRNQLLGDQQQRGESFPNICEECDKKS